MGLENWRLPVEAIERRVAFPAMGVLTLVAGKYLQALETEVIVPPRHEVMGTLGVALLAWDWSYGQETRFKRFEVALADHRATSFECNACPNVCEIVQIRTDGRVMVRWGGRCERWDLS